MLLSNLSEILTDVKLQMLGDVAALVRSHMGDLIPLKGTIKKTTETMPLTLKQY